MIIQPESSLITPQNNYYPMPMVIERSGNREQAYDIYSRLLKDRIVFLGTAIDDHVANAVTLFCSPFPKLVLAMSAAFSPCKISIQVNKRDSRS